MRNGIDGKKADGFINRDLCFECERERLSDHDLAFIDRCFDASGLLCPHSNSTCQQEARQKYMDK